MKRWWNTGLSTPASGEWKAWLMWLVLCPVLRLVALVSQVFLDHRIPRPPGRLLSCLFHPFDTLSLLEFLSDVYFRWGSFWWDGRLYIVDPKVALRAVNKLDKGAHDYLPSSPLHDSLLGTADRSPDLRHVIAARFRKSAIEAKGQKIQEVVLRAVDRVGRDGEKDEEKVVDVTDIIMKMALDVVGAALLDLDLGALSDCQGRLLIAMETILHQTFALGHVTPGSKAFEESSRDLDEVTGCILRKCLEMSEVGEDGQKEGEEMLEDTNKGSRGDNFVLQLYTAGGMEEAHSNLKLFLMAGTETTASSLPLMLHMLAHRPHIQAELQAETDEWIGALTQDPSRTLPRLDSALRELLRTFPTAPYISRRTDTEVELPEMTLPAQCDLRIFMWGMHRSRSLWSHPKDFLPQRFITSSATGSQSNCWIPFGAGSRVCIGQHLAWLEMKLALTYFLHYFHFQPATLTPEMEFCVDWEHSVVHPRSPVVLKVTRRQPGVATSLSR